MSLKIVSLLYLCSDSHITVNHLDDQTQDSSQPIQGLLLLPHAIERDKAFSQWDYQKSNNTYFPEASSKCFPKHLLT